MNTGRWQFVGKLAAMLAPPPVSPAAYDRRLLGVERDLVLPVKALFIGAIAWSFQKGSWFSETGFPRSAAMQVVLTFFVFYTILNLAGAATLLLPRFFSARTRQYTVFAVSFVDGLFLSALTLVTGGFESILFWVFPALVVRNAVSFPLALPQMLLNLSVCLSFVLGGLLDILITAEDIRVLDDATLRALEIAMPENPAEILMTRLAILLLLAACCYGLQILLENERRVAEESRESASRQEQLRAAGRLAAEIAHKIKNPLGIISNAAFTLQRALEQNQTPSLQQVRIIREEVERSDRIITELMGYAQLAEGKVEKLNVVEEINRAITTVFPPGARYSVQIHTEFSSQLPPLLMQRAHLSEVLVNILLNAREALGGLGQIHIKAWAEEDLVRITIQDDGPGIPPDQSERIFEPYFSTKPKGTGLGLSIVRHHVEMYQGRVRVESAPGQGASFHIELPTRTFMKQHP